MYEPYTWQTGEVITAEKLNNLEQGVAGNDLFAVITASIDPDTHGISLSKTNAEILTLVKNGKVPVIVMADRGLMAFYGSYSGASGSESIAFSSVPYANAIGQVSLLTLIVNSDNSVIPGEYRITATENT